MSVTPKNSAAAFDYEQKNQCERKHRPHVMDARGHERVQVDDMIREGDRKQREFLHLRGRIQDDVERRSDGKSRQAFDRAHHRHQQGAEHDECGVGAHVAQQARNSSLLLELRSARESCSGRWNATSPYVSAANNHEPTYRGRDARPWLRILFSANRRASLRPEPRNDAFRPCTRARRSR